VKSLEEVFSSWFFREILRAAKDDIYSLARLTTQHDFFGNRSKSADKKTSFEVDADRKVGA